MPDLKQPKLNLSYRTTTNVPPYSGLSTIAVGVQSAISFEPVCDFLRQVLLSLVNRTNRRKQLASQHIFVKIRLDAEAKRSPDAIVIVQGSDDNEPGFGKFAAQCRDDFFSADLRQIPINERDVGLKSPESLDGFLAVARLAYYSHVRLGVDDSRDSLAHPCMIINDQNPYSLCLQRHARG